MQNRLENCIIFSVGYRLIIGRGKDNMKKIAIKVDSTQDDGEEKTRVKTDTTGKLYIKQGTYYLKYEERIAKEKVKTTLKVKENSLKLIRRGEIETVQEFIPNKRTSFNYQTPYGTLKFSIEVSNLVLDIGSKRGEVQLEYSLFDEQEQFVSKNQLTLDYFIEED